MSNSALACYRKISPNRTSPRNHAIDTVTVHCMAGHMTIEQCGNWFESPSTKASSNYGIGDDGRIAIYVDEEDRAWCSSNDPNDHRAITIEVASDSTRPHKITDAALHSLINLLYDICTRNNIDHLRWLNDKRYIGQPQIQNVTVHRWFANKDCPGEYIMGKLPDIVSEVNRMIDEHAPTPTPPEPEPEPTPEPSPEIPVWAKPTVDKLVEKGYIRGTGSGLSLSVDMLRVLVIVDRAGAFDIN